MATIISTNQTSDYTLVSGDTIILRDFAYATQFSIDDTVDDVSLFILGDIFNDTLAAIDFYYGALVAGNDIDVTIGEGASVFGTTDGIIFDETSGDTTVNNHGLISVSEQAIYSEGGGLDVLNTGIITSIGNSETIQFFDFTDTGLNTVVNSGLIENLGAGRSAIYNYGGIFEVTNTGMISAQDLAIEATASTNTADIWNSGDIIGDIEIEAELSNHLDNTGLINGDITFDSGGSTDGDFIGNKGLISGEVSFGDSDDEYFGAMDGWVTDLINGGGGNDVIRGGSYEDYVIGGSGNDVIRGRIGDDDLLGGSGNDVILGGKGDDAINGGSGQDVITGGTGDDNLTGGNGSDRFVFGLKSGDDVITDFTNDLDVIDLRAYGIANTGELTSAGAIQSATGGVLIDLKLVGGDGTIFLDDMTVGQINNADFLF